MLFAIVVVIVAMVCGPFILTGLALWGLAIGTIIEHADHWSTSAFYLALGIGIPLGILIVFAKWGSTFFPPTPYESTLTWDKERKLWLKSSAPTPPPDQAGE